MPMLPEDNEGIKVEGEQAKKEEAPKKASPKKKEEKWLCQRDLKSRTSKILAVTFQHTNNKKNRKEQTKCLLLILETKKLVNTAFQ